MGNEQSVPEPRRPANKLSKPRTNSSVPPTSRTPAGINRRNSTLGNVGISSVQHSSVSVDAVVGEAGRGRTKEVPAQRKRMSLFRSRSSQAKSQMDITNGVEIDYLNESPVRSPVQWSRNSSVVELKRECAPVQRLVPPHHFRTVQLIVNPANHQPEQHECLSNISPLMPNIKRDYLWSLKHHPLDQR